MPVTQAATRTRARGQGRVPRQLSRRAICWVSRPIHPDYRVGLTLLQGRLVVASQPVKKGSRGSLQCDQVGQWDAILNTQSRTRCGVSPGASSWESARNPREGLLGVAFASAPRAQLGEHEIPRRMTCSRDCARSRAVELTAVTEASLWFPSIDLTQCSASTWPPTEEI